MVEPLEDTLRRLKKERDEADRRYNEALTALDRSVPSPSDWPPPQSSYDDSQLATLNGVWDTVAEPPAGSGWRGRLAGFVWRTVAPSLQRQLTFNSRLVDHLNRNAAASREAHQTAEETASRLREDFARLAEFHSRMMQYLQQITAYIDTKDRETAGGALVLNASLSGLAENIDKRWESLSVRDQRLAARTAALAASHDELRAMLGVSQQAVLSLKRELERILTDQGVQKVQEVQAVQGVQERLRPERGAEPPSEGERGWGPASVEKRLRPERGAESPSESERGWGPASVEKGPFRTIDSYKYVGFEDQFRGSREMIRARLEGYLPYFRELSHVDSSPVLDVGCGRGEFLELLASAGIRARGIDLNHEMAELCRARGLDVTEADAVGHLSALPDASLGGLFAAQVVEHVHAGYLLRFLELAFHKLRPGGRIVLETLNPACWVAFFDSYIRDITHVWPLHPDTLKYLVLASGFTRADIEYRTPVAPHDRLQSIAASYSADATLADIVEAFNANVEKLNARMFTHLDYAVIGAR